MFIFTGCSFKQGILRPFLEFVKEAQEWHSRYRQHGSIESDDTEHEPDVMNSGDSTVVFLPANGDTPRIHGFDGAVLVIADMEVSVNLGNNVPVIFYLFMYLFIIFLAMKPRDPKKCRTHRLIFRCR